MFRAVLAAVLIAFGTCQAPGQVVFYGPPIVEKAPILLSSFLPASMQIIAHLTDLMKYEIRPAATGTTSTTIRPTPSHKPGIYSPKDPLGAAAYFARGTSYQEYIERLKSPQGFGYFDRYMYPFEHSEKEYLPGSEQNGQPERAKSLEPPSFADLADDDLELLGQGLSDLFKQVNKIDDYDFVDDDEKVLRFSENYDDSNVRNYVIGNKKIPPTRAYVTLLSLYDLLNKESKKLQLNKYGGFATDVLRVLVESSTGSAADQLHTVLGKIVERRDVKEQPIINKIKTLLSDLEQSGSYINDALRYIPPLRFTQ